MKRHYSSIFLYHQRVPNYFLSQQVLQTSSISYSKSATPNNPAAPITPVHSIQTVELSVPARFQPSRSPTAVPIPHRRVRTRYPFPRTGIKSSAAGYKKQLYTGAIIPLTMIEQVLLYVAIPSTDPV